MRGRPLLMQLLIGMSISRYLPATGTAGALRCRVKGYRPAPRPPPRMKVMTSCMVFPLRMPLLFLLYRTPARLPQGDSITGTPRKGDLREIVRLGEPPARAPRILPAAGLVRPRWVV